MARDPDAIERDIEQAREALAATLDRLSEKAHPKRFVEYGKSSVRDKLEDPRVRYALIGVGALVAIVVVRNLFR
ncbi:hypothetical protein GCM10011581_06750 [Saccharopolyspora subtropica]|uniref:DUF3618 domain-containing protein n=1 Tax=Saccharopolyspora thermophila TaxID=89367 RepID=A0A917N6Z0_9PSEU|nr:DUF3618 domain-containing protein [Saccharopolyspora subtropica]GGI72409.1 hypothetical protein GCM10011581_06750 [Saccharopolyspora subtropica]